MVAPILIVLLGWRWSGWQGAILACVAAGVLAAGAWTTSPYIRERVQRAIDDVEIYRTTHLHNDVGDHIEFVKKSIAFVCEAPVIGHGTGSIPELLYVLCVGIMGGVMNRDRLWQWSRLHRADGNWASKPQGRRH